MRNFQANARWRNALRSGVAFSGLALSLAVGGAAHAQDSSQPSAEDIVVTGTLIRGVAPAGTNVVGVTAEQVESTGATTVTDLLTKVPQFGNFNGLQGTTSSGSTITTNRPNLRGLPGQDNTGTSATLLLVDGHRVVGMGIASTVPDADFLPPAMIERIEIVPDGGSALYGSDAVAGVVNFITMKRFDGVKVDARYGFGKDFHTFDADATIGKDWGTGSAWVSYNYTENSSILGKDRDFNFTPESYAPGTTTVIRSLECVKPNIFVAAAPGGPATLYGAPLPSAPRVANICDNTDNAAMYPEQKRHSVYAGLYQELNDWLDVNVQAFYYRKEVDYQVGEPFGSVNIGPSFLAPFGFVSSPYNTVSVTGSPAETKAINFTLGPDHIAHKLSTLDAWGYSGEFKAKLGGDWQARVRAGYSESQTESDSQQLNLNLVGPLTASGAFNPFSPASSSPAAIAQLLDYEDYGLADQRQINLRAIADGTLFTGPGGDVKMAIGAEFTKEGYDIRKGLTVASQHNKLPRFNLSRNVKSVFGEVVAPVFGSNGGASLTLSASGRYDDYSDVGGTFNPKFGATFKPIDWISIRGAWGKSFVAPSLADSAVADPTDARFVSGATVSFLAPPQVLAANGFPPVASNQNILILLGANPGLKPQKATTWSLGMDVDPPFAPGLRLSGTYYNITYKDIITQVPFVNQAVYFSTYAPQSFTLNPTLAQINEALADDPDGAGTPPCAPLPTCVYGIEDVRKQNLSGFKQSGIDFAASYATATGFGGVDFNVGGTYILTRAGAPTAGAAFKSELDTFNSRLKVRTTLGADVGQLRGQATWNFSQGFDVPPSGLANQTHVGDFNTVDLYFKYDFNQEGMFNDLELNLTVTNVFDQDPPVYYGGGISSRLGFANGNTFGRLVQVGFKKKF
jgi:iron complex outermembrane receptor protein